MNPCFAEVRQRYLEGVFGGLQEASLPEYSILAGVFFVLQQRLIVVIFFLSGIIIYFFFSGVHRLQGIMAGKRPGKGGSYYS